MPLVGGLYYLLMIGEVPTREQALEVEAEWARRWEVPDYVYKMLKSMPDGNAPDDALLAGRAGAAERIGFRQTLS